MAKAIKVGDFVVCNINQGYMMEGGVQSDIPSFFERGAVGVMRKAGRSASRVYLIGQNEDYMISNKSIAVIDPTKTGKGFSKKICNICHVLKPHSAFEINQTDAKGRKTSRPSCQLCRRGIDQKPMTAAAKKEAEKDRPQAGTLWRCPICQKRSIVGVTAKVVLDHRHSDGASRRFLCDSCNTGLGRFKNGSNYLRNAIAYLEKFEQSVSEDET